MRSLLRFYVCLRFALLFFVCTNYLTVVYCNQPCIVFIYILYIFCCWVEKEPLPQSVEVLSHAAARAATFFSFWAVMRTASQVVTVRGCSVFQSCAVIQSDRDWAFSVSVLGFNLMQSRRLLLYKGEISGLPISILCSHTDCDDTDSTILPEDNHFNLMQSYRLRRLWGRGGI